jgi:hypothetical protein
MLLGYFFSLCCAAGEYKRRKTQHAMVYWSDAPRFWHAACALLVWVCMLVGADGQASCGQWTTCSKCTIEGGCGWCAATSACEAGNATRSFVGCTNTSWTWLQWNCSAPEQPTIAPPPTSSCSSAKDCVSCTELSACGWCSQSGQCESGNATGGFQGCAVPYWSWTQYQCPNTAGPSPLCNYYNGYCTTCTSTSNCGYCASTGMCEVGNVSGSFSGDCSASHWIWGGNATCP